MKEYLNYFSKADKKGLFKFSEYRYKLLKPLSKVLTLLKITPDMISYFGLLILTGFAYYLNKKPLIAGIFLIIHILLDGIDGPLAKYQKKAGNKGALTDIICDHTGIIIVTLTLIYYRLLNGTIGAAYIYIYTLLIIFTVIRNKLEITPNITFRSKYFVYLCLIPLIYNKTNILNYAILAFSIIKIPFTIDSYIKIKRKL